MLGKEIIDNAIEGDEASRISGLGFLDISTEFKEYNKEKSLVEAEIACNRGMLRGAENGIIKGYEIHMGRSRILNVRNTKVAIKSKNKILGACDGSGMVFGCYVHGLFDMPPLRNSLLNFITEKKKNKRARAKRKAASFKIHEIWEKEIGRIAEVVKNNVAMESFI